MKQKGRTAQISAGDAVHCIQPVKNNKKMEAEALPFELL